MFRHVGEVAGAVLQAGNGLGVACAQTFDQRRRQRHLGYLWEVIEIDAQPIVTDALDDLGKRRE